MTLGSLFDGIGGFPLSASRYGIETKWASEIEAFPIAVTKFHFPNMLHVGGYYQAKRCHAPTCGYRFRWKSVSGSVCGGNACRGERRTFGSVHGANKDSKGDERCR